MLLWATLAFLVVAVIAAATFAGVTGFRLWRGVKRTKAAFGAELARIEATNAEIQSNLERMQDAQGRLQEATAGFAAARAALGVQVAAVLEAREQVRRMLWFVPGV